MDFLHVRRKDWPSHNKSSYLLEKHERKYDRTWSKFLNPGVHCDVPSVIEPPSSSDSSGSKRAPVWCDKPRVIVRPTFGEPGGTSVPRSQGYATIPSYERPGKVSGGDHPYADPYSRTSRDASHRSRAPGSEKRKERESSKKGLFSIQIFWPHHDFGTSFLVSSNDPNWYSKLLASCWACLQTNAGRSGRAIAQGTRLHHLATYPEYEDISKKTDISAVAGKLIIPRFSRSGVEPDELLCDESLEKFENIGKKSKKTKGKKHKKKKPKKEKKNKEKSEEDRKDKYFGKGKKEKKRRREFEGTGESEEDRRIRKKTRRKEYKQALQRWKREKPKKGPKLRPDDMEYQRRLVEEGRRDEEMRHKKRSIEEREEEREFSKVGSSFRNLFGRSCAKKFAEKPERRRVRKSSVSDEERKESSSGESSEDEATAEDGSSYSTRRAQLARRDEEARREREEERRRKLTAELVGGNMGNCLSRAKACFYSTFRDADAEARSCHDESPCDWDRLYCRKVTTLPKTTTITLTTSAPCIATPPLPPPRLADAACPSPSVSCSTHDVSAVPCKGSTFDACSSCHALRACSSFSSLVVAPDYHNAKKKENAALFFADFLDNVVAEVPERLAKMKNFQEICAFLESGGCGPDSPSFAAECIRKVAGAEGSPLEGPGGCEGVAGSLWGLVLVLVTEKVDYSRIGGSLTGFVKFFVPEDGTTILFLVLRGLCCYLEDAVRRWVGSKEVSDCLIDRKSAMKTTEEELKEKRQEKEVAALTLRNIYAIAKGKENLPPVAELESVTDAEAVAELGTNLGERFVAAKNSLRECENAEKMLESRSAELAVGEVLTYKAKMIATRCATENLDAFEAFLEELCVFARTRKDVLDPFREAVAGACASAACDAAKIAAKASRDGDRSNSGFQSSVGSNMRSVHGASRQDFLKRTAFGPSFYAESGFVTRPGSCEDNVLRAQQYALANCLPDQAELEEAADLLEEVNEKMGDMEADGTLVEVEDGCEDFYHSYDARSWKHRPYEDDCYVVDSELLENLDAAGTDCNQEAMELYRELEEERCARERLETKPRETTTITMTTTK